MNRHATRRPRLDPQPQAKRVPNLVEDTLAIVLGHRLFRLLGLPLDVRRLAVRSCLDGYRHTEAVLHGVNWTSASPLDESRPHLKPGHITNHEIRNPIPLC